MPRRNDIHKILIIGSGPIVIGQACEFDYSGAQACKALRSEGYQVVLVNSNPATIMTDPELADRTYIEPLDYAIDNIRGLLGRTPIFGICLGHQLLGLALGGKTYKLKFGHRGGNQPVKNLIKKNVEITAHNHGFAVDPGTLKERDIQITHVNLNDQTLEGFRHRHWPVFSVQYHPEASPGPHDSLYLFDDFVQLMKEHKER